MILNCLTGKTEYCHVELTIYWQLLMYYGKIADLPLALKGILCVCHRTCDMTIYVLNGLACDLATSVVPRIVMGACFLKYWEYCTVLVKPMTGE